MDNRIAPTTSPPPTLSAQSIEKIVQAVVRAIAEYAQDHSTLGAPQPRRGLADSGGASGSGGGAIEMQPVASTTIGSDLDAFARDFAGTIHMPGAAGFLTGLLGYGLGVAGSYVGRNIVGAAIAQAARQATTIPSTFRNLGSGAAWGQGLAAGGVVGLGYLITSGSPNTTSNATDMATSMLFASLGVGINGAHKIIGQDTVPAWLPAQLTPDMASNVAVGMATMTKWTLSAGVPLTVGSFVAKGLRGLLDGNATANGTSGTSGAPAPGPTKLPSLRGLLGQIDAANPAIGDQLNGTIARASSAKAVSTRLNDFMKAQFPAAYRAFSTTAVAPAEQYGAAIQQLETDAKRYSDVQAQTVLDFAHAHGRLPSDGELNADTASQAKFAALEQTLVADKHVVSEKRAALDAVTQPYLAQAEALYLQSQYGPPAHEVGLAKVGALTPSGNAGVHVAGGVWANNPSYENNVAVLTPQLSRPDLLPQSYQDAQALASGANYAQVLGSYPAPDRVAALHDAYELLGISNRQIAFYAKTAAAGGVDASFSLSNPTQAGTDALHALQVAGRMRAAVDPNPSFGLEHVDDTYTSESAVTRPFSTGGLSDAVLAGVQAAGTYWEPQIGRDDILFGRGGVNFGDGIFQNHDAFFNAPDYSASYQAGRQSLASSNFAIEQW